MRELWQRFKAWWNPQFDDWAGADRETEWLLACHRQERMQLRDEFAKAALMRMTDPEWSQLSPKELAAQAYDQADAMLAERDKEGGE